MPRYRFEALGGPEELARAVTVARVKLGASPEEASTHQLRLLNTLAGYVRRGDFKKFWEVLQKDDKDMGNIRQLINEERENLKTRSELGQATPENY